MVFLNQFVFQRKCRKRESNPGH